VDRQALVPASDLENALSVFAAVASSIGEGRFTMDKPKHVAFLVE
jgi:hypothetical protein